MTTAGGFVKEAPPKIFDISSIKTTALVRVLMATFVASIFCIEGDADSVRRFFDPRFFLTDFLEFVNYQPIGWLI